MLGEQISHAPFQTPETSTPTHHNVQDLVRQRRDLSKNLAVVAREKKSGDLIRNGMRVRINGMGNFQIETTGVSISIGPYKDDYFGIMSDITVNLQWEEEGEQRRGTYCFNEDGQAVRSRRNGHPEAGEPMTVDEIDRVYERLEGINGLLQS